MKWFLLFIISIIWMWDWCIIDFIFVVGVWVLIMCGKCCLKLVKIVIVDDFIVMVFLIIGYVNVLIVLVLYRFKVCIFFF